MIQSLATCVVTNNLSLKVIFRFTTNLLKILIPVHGGKHAVFEN